jgi:peptide/nickel transport system ATP-binding protein
MEILKVENLTVFYPNSKKPAVDKVSFSLRKGEILCIVGESGSGKSTLLYAIAGLLPRGCKVSGKVLFKERNLLFLSEGQLNKIRGKDIGFIFQEPSVYLDPLFPVGKQIEETCKIHSPEGAFCFQKTIEKLRYCGIADAERVYRSYPHQLSGGLKQRVNIADATVNDPLLLLADEPTTALDVSTQKAVLNLFRKLKEDGNSIILVTHDFGVVWEVADRVLVMKEGQKVEENDVFSLYRNPQHPYTKRLVEIFKKLSEF